MSGPAFDDARLESPDLAWNESLRRLATAGARIRRAALRQPLGHAERGDRPRKALHQGSREPGWKRGEVFDSGHGTGGSAAHTLHKQALAAARPGGMRIA